MAKSVDWRSKVYYQKAEQVEENWDQIRESILTRDRRKCLRCDKTFAKRNLSVHHLTPRNEGGVSIPSNLVTLCHPCHDIVEIEKLRTTAAIVGSFYDEPTKEKNQKPIKYKKESFERPEWHKRVYGGYRD